MKLITNYFIWWTGQCKKLNIKKFHSSSHLCKKDYYSVLGVKRNASQEEIRKAYLKVSN